MEGGCQGAIEQARGGRQEWSKGREGGREGKPAEGPTLIFIHAIVNGTDLSVQIVVRREGDEAGEQRVQRPLPLVEHLQHSYHLTQHLSGTAPGYADMRV